MNWDGSDRKSRLPSNWSTLVDKVRQRAGGRCEWKLPSGARCPRPGTDCDHRRAGDDHSLSNLQWLCRTHHGRKSAQEGVFGRRRKKLPPRSEERHPGLRPSQG